MMGLQITPSSPSLTLTWDVFKLAYVHIVIYFFFCLTLTWDVFKFLSGL